MKPCPLPPTPPTPWVTPWHATEPIPLPRQADMAEPRLSLPVTPARFTAGRGKSRPSRFTSAREPPQRSRSGESGRRSGASRPRMAPARTLAPSRKQLARQKKTALRAWASMPGSPVANAPDARGKQPSQRVRRGKQMSHAAHGSGRGVPGGNTRPDGVSRSSTGATFSRTGRQPWGEWERTVEGERGGVAVPELATFAGAKRTQLAALTKSTAVQPLREAMENVTRVASMRPRTFGRIQVLARLRALSRPALPWGDAGLLKTGLLEGSKALRSVRGG
jgi:hypothetical protein